MDMVKDKIRFIFRLPVIGCCFALLCFWAGCVQEDAFTVAKNPDLRCPLSVSNLRTAVAAGLTRAAGSDAIPAGEQIGFYLKTDGDLYTTALTNKVSIYDNVNSLWMPQGDTIWLYGVSADVAIYYPYKSGVSTNLLPLTRALRTDDTKDLWSIRFGANGGTATSSLILIQVYSRLTLTFVQDPDAPYTGTANMVGPTLTSPDLYPSGTFNVQDSTYAYSGTPSGFVPKSGTFSVKGTDPAATDAVVFDILLLPRATLTGDITVSTTVDGKAMKVVIPKEKLSGALAPGKQYKVTIVLKPKALMVSSIYTTDWELYKTFSSDANLDDKPVTRQSQLNKKANADETE